MCVNRAYGGEDCDGDDSTEEERSDGVLCVAELFRSFCRCG